MKDAFQDGGVQCFLPVSLKGRAAAAIVCFDCFVDKIEQTIKVTASDIRIPRKTTITVRTVRNESLRRFLKITEKHLNENSLLRLLR